MSPVTEALAEGADLLGENVELGGKIAPFVAKLLHLVQEILRDVPGQRRWPSPGFGGSPRGLRPSGPP